MAAGDTANTKQTTAKKAARHIQSSGKVATRKKSMKDIHRNWFNVIRRMQSVGRSKHVVGCGIVSINVVINSSGEPLFWSEPKCTLIEPMKDNSKLLDLLKREL